MTLISKTGEIRRSLEIGTVRKRPDLTVFQKSAKFNMTIGHKYFFDSARCLFSCHVRKCLPCRLFITGKRHSIREILKDRVLPSASRVLPSASMRYQHGCYLKIVQCDHKLPAPTTNIHVTVVPGKLLPELCACLAALRLWHLAPTLSSSGPLITVPGRQQKRNPSISPFFPYFENLISSPPQTSHF